MKKQLLKLSLLVAVIFSAPTFQAQDTVDEGRWTKPGYYTLGVQGQDLVMTVDANTLDLVWAPRVADSPYQEWLVKDHVAPASNGFIQITAELPDGLGTVSQ
mgnify:CR=1 FL=1